MRKLFKVANIYLNKFADEVFQDAEDFPLETKSPSEPPSSRRLLDLENFERVDDEILDCYLTPINIKNNKKYNTVKLKIASNESLDKVFAKTKELQRLYLLKVPAIVKVHVLLTTRSSWSNFIGPVSI